MRLGQLGAQGVAFRSRLLGSIKIRVEAGSYEVQFFTQPLNLGRIGVGTFSISHFVRSNQVLWIFYSCRLRCRGWPHR